jgi:hypothetical protein
VTTGVIISVFLISLAVLSVFFGIDIGIGNSLVAAAVSAVPLLVVVPVFLWVDRMESEPVRYLIFAFLWGALCAAVGAIILNTGIHLIFLAAHTDNADAVTAVVSAPLVEETLKGAAILFIAWRRRREFDGVIDGIVYAGMAGAGFAFSENILYLGRAFAEAGDVRSDRGVLPAVPHGAVRAPAVHGVHGDRDRLGRDGRAIRGRSDRLRDCGVGGRDGPARDLEPQRVGGRLPAGLPRLPDADLRRFPCRVGPAAPARSGVGAALPVAVRRCWLVHQS